MSEAKQMNTPGSMCVQGCGMQFKAAFITGSRDGVRVYVAKGPLMPVWTWTWPSSHAVSWESLWNSQQGARQMAYRDSLLDAGPAQRAQPLPPPPNPVFRACGEQEAGRRMLRYNV